MVSRSHGCLGASLGKERWRKVEDQEAKVRMTVGCCCLVKMTRCGEYFAFCVLRWVLGVPGALLPYKERLEVLFQRKREGVKEGGTAGAG